MSKTKLHVATTIEDDAAGAAVTGGATLLTAGQP